jgi:epoxide hydrolase
MQSFRLQVPESQLDDLRQRLTRTRWPTQLSEVGWSRGVPISYLKKLVAYWADGYDWRAQQDALNQHSQHLTVIDGQRIHLVHARSARPDNGALLLLHGWPGSIVEYLGLVQPLTACGYHVVVPSIPGFGFSTPLSGPGWDTRRIAAAFVQLMNHLGYVRFGAVGSDWGAMICREIGRMHPDRITGVYLTMLPAAVPTTEPTEADTAGLTDQQRTELHESWQRRTRMQSDEIGYGIVQSTRPQTLAYALTDSPAGQLAWIIEKFQAWTDNTGSPEDAIDRDTLLTNVMLYWLTGSADSSANLYYEAAHSEQGWAGTAQPSTAPTGVGIFPHDTSLPVRHLAERTDNITHWTRFPRGGHFPALEAPDTLLADLLIFFSKLRTDESSTTQAET